MNRKIGIITALLTAVIFGLTGCQTMNKNSIGGADKPADISIEDTKRNEKIQVYTSFYAMEDFAKTICGEYAEVKSLVPSGIEPHDYEPSAKDIAALNEADVFIYSGAGMEHWADSVVHTLPESVTVVNASRGIELDSMEEDGGHDHLSDPHIWLSPELAAVQAENICNGIVNADAGHKEVYCKNMEAFRQELKELGKEYRAALSGKRVDSIVVTHEAFGYLCEFLDLDQIGIAGVQGDLEPSPARMADIIEEMREEQIRVVFAEEAGSDKTAQAVAAETGAEVLTLNTFEGDSAGRSYLAVMKENLENLKRAVQ